MTDLVDGTIQAIAQMMRARAADIGHFARTEYSFEEWFNWECYAACLRAGLNVAPKASYSSAGLEGSRSIGDLRVSGDDRLVMIENKIIHRATQEKFYDLVNEDTRKLTRLRKVAADCVDTMQIVVVASYRAPVIGHDGWSSWLGRLDVWNRPTDREAIAPMPPSGEVVLRGWCNL